MSNQYSYGCGYNYRRSQSRETSCQGARGSRAAVQPKAECRMAAPEQVQERPFSQWPVAMGYVPMQMWSQPVSLCRGLQAGTIFADLDKPFCGKGGAWK